MRRDRARVAGLAMALRRELRCKSAVLDGELAALDDEGRPAVQ